MLLDSVRWERIGPTATSFLRPELATNKYTHVQLNMFLRVIFKSMILQFPIFPTTLIAALDPAHVSSGGVATRYNDQHLGAADNFSRRPWGGYG